MSALACILKNLDHEVIGSDSTNYYFTQQKLEENNIEMLPYNTANITKDIDVVVIGNAINASNVEFIEAKGKNLVCKSYKEVVADMCGCYNSIAIAGTNGKTTTTALTATMFEHKDKIVLIGDGTGYANKNADTFIFEACEYQNTFFEYSPNIGLINNIVMDHPDFFTSTEMLIASFQQFANNCETIIINNDDELCKYINHKDCVTFGVSNFDSDFVFKNIKQDKNGFCAELFVKGKMEGLVSFPFYASHMYLNTLACIAIGYICGLELDIILKNICKFKGAKRRFEITEIDKLRDFIVIDDYAHHPTAIDVTIDAIRQKYPDYTLNLFFQPHTFTRVNSFLSEFALSLAKADNVYLHEIFGSAREKDSEINITVVVDEVKKYKNEVYTNLDFIDTTKDKQIFAVLGAGDINNIIIPKIKEYLEGRK